MTTAALAKAAQIIAESSNTICLSGAGISVDSGIPDFRGHNGLWERYDPFEYAHIESFKSNPKRVWNMLFEMCSIMIGVVPNAGHIALAELENLGKLKAVITQNIDNLHQEAGNREVIEFHGNCHRLSCIECGKMIPDTSFDLSDTTHPPVCECGAILKPDVIFFGETIPPVAYKRSMILAQTSDVILVVGTSAQVAPANMLPSMVSSNNGTIIEVNLEKTHLSETYGAIHLHGSTTDILPSLVKEVRSLLNDK